MSTTTLEHAVAITVVDEPLTEAETDALIGVTAANEKTARVHGQPGESRAWGRSAQVD